MMQLVAPTIGAVMTGFAKSQASAIVPALPARLGLRRPGRDLPIGFVVLAKNG